MSARRLLALVVCAGVAAVCGCDEGNPLSPVPVPGDAGEPPSDAGVPPEDAGSDASIKRTVIQRNPFGNVAETENLLWDGDFEWSSPFADQYGWINYPQTGYGFSGVRVGIECRSGLKCVAIDDGDALIGIGVSSAGSTLRASIRVRPAADNPSCDGVTATLLALYGGDPDVALDVAPEKADAGWCLLEVVAPERSEKTILFVENESGAEVIVDDAIVARAVEAQAIRARPDAPTADALSRRDGARAELERRRGPRDTPPGAGERAFEAWARGRGRKPPPGGGGR